MILLSLLIWSFSPFNILHQLTFGSQPTLNIWDKSHCLSCKTILLCYLDYFANILLRIVISFHEGKLSVMFLVCDVVFFLWCFCQALISGDYGFINWIVKYFILLCFLKDLLKSWHFFFFKWLVELTSETILAWALDLESFKITNSMIFLRNFSLSSLLSFDVLCFSRNFFFSFKFLT